jgi:hypothetical protein
VKHYAIKNVCRMKAPLKELQRKFGFEPERVADSVKASLPKS